MVDRGKDRPGSERLERYRYRYRYRAGLSCGLQVEGILELA